jgi:hypothetical protein
MAALHITHHTAVKAREFETLYGKMSRSGRRILPGQPDLDANTPSPKREANTALLTQKRNQFIHFLSQSNQTSQQARGQWLLRLTTLRDHVVKDRATWEKDKIGLTDTQRREYRHQNRPTTPQLTPILLLNNHSPEETRERFLFEPLSDLIWSWRHELKKINPAVIVTGTHGIGGTLGRPWTLSTKHGKHAIKVTDLFQRSACQSYQGKPVLIGACTDFGFSNIDPSTHARVNVNNNQIRWGKPTSYAVSPQVMSAIDRIHQWDTTSNNTITFSPNFEMGQNYRDYVKQHHGIDLPSKDDEWVLLPQ